MPRSALELSISFAGEEEREISFCMGGGLHRALKAWKGSRKFRDFFLHPESYLKCFLLHRRLHAQSSHLDPVPRHPSLDSDCLSTTIHFATEGSIACVTHKGGIESRARDGQEAFGKGGIKSKEMDYTR